MKTYDKDSHKIYVSLTFDRKREKKNVHIGDHLMHFDSQNDSQISV